MTPEDRFLDLDVRLHARLWPGDAEPFLLLHGLASNARTWDAVAAHLCAEGHPVAALDQRGHGRSDKPDRGYDFPTLAADLVRVLEALGWARPLVVGQSWGGNVALELGALHPTRAAGLGFVDGGYLDLRARPGASWERVAQELRPPNLLGRLRTDLARWIREAHPDWTDEGIEATLENFETLPDGTVRPWLTLERHLAILRELWEQRVVERFSRVRAPVLICAAEGGPMPPELRRRQVAAAEAGLRRSVTRWFPETDHDIHVHRPALLARIFLDELRAGVWAPRP